MLPQATLFDIEEPVQNKVKADSTESAKKDKEHKLLVLTFSLIQKCVQGCVQNT